MQRSSGRIGGRALAAALVLALAVPGVAQIPGRDVGGAERAVPSNGRKVALVVGNGGYHHVQDLAQARRDARNVGPALQAAGFEVRTVIDLDRDALHQEVVDFGRRLRGASVGLVYYAGHGVEFAGRNYLIPVDAEIPDPDYIDIHAYNVRLVLEQMDLANSLLNVVVLDACRDNPWVSRWRSLGTATRSYRDGGLGQIGEPGFLVAYATAPGDVAADSGVYAEALVKHMGTECISLSRAFGRVQEQVSDRTGGRQVPWVHSGAGQAPHDFYPAGCPQPPQPQPRPVVPVAAPRTGRVSSRPPDTFPGRGSQAGQAWTSPSGMAFRWVPSGRFQMGSPPTEGGRGDDETQHQVTLTKGLWVMESEVTQGLWAEVMESEPSRFDACGSDCPVEQVSWLEAVAFANALTAREAGLDDAYTIRGEEVSWNRGAGGYRLLTEAEWEYAARGGEDFVYAGSNEVSEVGWVGESLGEGSTHPVCGKRRNGYELCDMSGNVWEWVWDWKGDYSGGSEQDPSGPAVGSVRVNRGGGWYSFPPYARVALRFKRAPGSRYHYLGLRLARPAP